MARTVLALLAALLIALPAQAATIIIINLDGAGEGFNDPTPAAPVGGNPGTTIGAQRLYVFQYAANIWGSLLPSNVPIYVEANFDPQTCDGQSAVLGSAGPNQTWANFANAPRTNTWYHEALANKLAGYDLDPATADIGTTFNSNIGQPNCFPVPWYYGVDGNEGTAVELLPVVLHELGHGLGFSSTSLGGVQQVFPGAYDWQLWDRTQGMFWPQMTDPQRTASTQNCGNLFWDGPSVRLQSPSYLGSKPLLRVHSGAAAGDYEVGLPAFGPGLTETGVTQNLVYVNDGMGQPGNGCETILNAAQVNGRIALIDRGGCPFVVKVKNAQNAGAIGVVIADSAAGCPALGMSGVDPTIVIPTVRITADDGAAIKAAVLAGTVSATMRIDPALRAGGDGVGRVNVYAAIPFAPGSSVSHWDISATPNLLMEPALNSDLSSGTDLTVAMFADIGWFQGVLDAGAPSRPVAALGASFPNPSSGMSTVRFALARPQHVDLAVYDLGGRLVAKLEGGLRAEGEHTVRWDGRGLDGRTVAAGIYHLRLRTPSLDERRNLVIIR